MMILKKTSWLSIAVGVVAIALLSVSPLAYAERLKDLATIQGVRDNPLVGYGLVVGLDGSGDQVRQTPFTQQSLTNMLSQLGVTLPQGSNMQLKNVAAVMVTAQLPAFSQPGQNIDVVVSSMGNAKSLRGGTLLMTPLKGADNQIYALAQGNILVGGAGADAGGSSVQVNQLNGGIISNGAVVERIVPTRVNRDGIIRLEMKDTDFGTTQNAVQAINAMMGPNSAMSTNGRVIEVIAPLDAQNQGSFIARLQNIQVTRAAARAKVIINARTGTVVMNQTVTLDQAAVAYGNLSVVIDQGVAVSQPNTPFAGGQTVVAPTTRIEVQSQPGQLTEVRTSVRLTDVIKALNSLGASPQELLSILQALKSAGSLRADLEII